MGGEEVTLASPNGGVIQDFTYSGSWYPQTHGGGFVLMARNTNQALSLWNSSLGWQPSGTPGGTPGKADPVTVPAAGAIVINEVAANPTGTPGDMIELYNTTTAVDHHRRLVPQRQQFQSDGVPNRLRHDDRRQRLLCVDAGL